MVVFADPYSFYTLKSSENIFFTGREGRKAAIFYIFLISQTDLEETLKLIEKQNSHMLGIVSHVGAHKVIKENEEDIKLCLVWDD